MRTSTGARYVVVPGVGRLDQREDDWRDSATCAVNPGVDHDIFFSPNHAEMDAAKAICATCPVVDKCRAWGDKVEDSTLSNLYGVLGGEGPLDRATRRRRALPSKKRPDSILNGKIQKLDWSKPQNCVFCGRLMRHRSVHLEDAPGTILYGGDSMCFTCYHAQKDPSDDSQPPMPLMPREPSRGGRRAIDWSGPRYCKGCGRLMRNPSIRPADAPGTVAYRARGLCRSCHRRQRGGSK